MSFAKAAPVPTLSVPTRCWTGVAARCARNAIIWELNMTMTKTSLIQRTSAASVFVG